MSNYIKLRCGHSLCKMCRLKIKQSILTQCCPLCRFDITQDIPSLPSVKCTGIMTSVLLWERYGTIRLTSPTIPNLISVIVENIQFHNKRLPEIDSQLSFTLVQEWANWEKSSAVLKNYAIDCNIFDNENEFKACELDVIIEYNEKGIEVINYDGDDGNIRFVGIMRNLPKGRNDFGFIEYTAGFADFNITDNIFVHVKQCKSGFVPKEAELVSFDLVYSDRPGYESRLAATNCSVISLAVYRNFVLKFKAKVLGAMHDKTARQEAEDETMQFEHDGEIESMQDEAQQVSEDDEEIGSLQEYYYEDMRDEEKQYLARRASLENVLRARAEGQARSRAAAKARAEVRAEAVRAEEKAVQSSLLRARSNLPLFTASQIDALSVAEQQCLSTSNIGIAPR